MARPTKQGVDYFPLDVHFDDKVKFVEIKYKLEGFAIFIKLMQKIYANGYWCKWTEDEILLFSDEIKADFSLVDNVAKECLKREIFDSSIHEKYGVLTSKGIQKRYKEMVRRRKDVEVISEYLLIDDINGVIDDINSGNGQHPDGKSTQSKVNKTKVNKTKVKDTPLTPLKVQYAEYVTMTEKEYTSLIEKHGTDKTAKLIEILDNYKGATGKKYKSDYRAILTWVVDRWDEDNRKKGVQHGKTEAARRFKEENDLPF